MNLQIIKSTDGEVEYVLLPIQIYNSLRKEIKRELKNIGENSDYLPFNPEDYVENPVALKRIKAHLTQEELAKRMKVTQAYISKIERQDTVSMKLLQKVENALKRKF